MTGAATTLWESPSGFFSFRYPAHWHCEQVSGRFLIYNKSAKVGAVMLSAYQVPEAEVAPPGHHLRQYLADKDEPVDEARIAAETDHATGLQRATTAYVDDVGAFWQIWFVALGRKVVLATYNCWGGQEGKEHAEVQALIASVTL